MVFGSEIVTIDDVIPFQPPPAAEAADVPIICCDTIDDDENRMQQGDADVTPPAGPAQPSADIITDLSVDPSLAALPPSASAVAPVLSEGLLAQIGHLIATANATQTINLLGPVENLTKRVEALNLQQNEKINQLNARIDSLVNRLDILESGPSASSHTDGKDSDSPLKRGRFASGPPAATNFPPASQASATQEKAKSPACLRSRGFEYKLPKPDMIAVAKHLCSHINIIAFVKEIHCSAIAGSCVVEFNSEQDARHSLELSKNGDTTWFDSATSMKTNLFFAYDESADIRAMGSALHHVYDSVNKLIVPHGPRGTSIQTNRRQGLLQLVVNKRFYPIFQISTSNCGESFEFVERKGRWNSFKIPSFVTNDMLTAIKADMATNELFK